MSNTKVEYSHRRVKPHLIVVGRRKAQIVDDNGILREIFADAREHILHRHEVSVLDCQNYGGQIDSLKC